MYICMCVCIHIHIRIGRIYSTFSQNFIPQLFYTFSTITIGSLDLAVSTLSALQLICYLYTHYILYIIDYIIYYILYTIYYILSTIQFYSSNRNPIHSFYNWLAQARPFQMDIFPFSMRGLTNMWAPCMTILNQILHLVIARHVHACT